MVGLERLGQESRRHCVNHSTHLPMHKSCVPTSERHTPAFVACEANLNYLLVSK